MPVRIKPMNRIPALDKRRRHRQGPDARASIRSYHEGRPDRVSSQKEYAL